MVKTPKTYLLFPDIVSLTKYDEKINNNNKIIEQCMNGRR